MAADLVIGDHGSVTIYAASLGVPVLLAAFPRDEVPPGSPAALLGQIAPRLRPGRPLLPQLEQAAAGYQPERYTSLRGQVTGVPGRAREVIRQVLYSQLGLAEPPATPVTVAVPLPYRSRAPPGPRGGRRESQGPEACRGPRDREIAQAGSARLRPAGRSVR